MGKTYTSDRLLYKTALIDVSADADLSAAVDIGTGTLVGFITDSNFTTSNVKFHAPIAEGSSTFVVVTDADGADVTASTVAASKFVALSPIGIQGLGQVKFETVTDQVSDTTITAVIKRD